MKRILFLTLVLMSSALVQAQDCYEPLLNKGIAEYNAGNYETAKKKWTGALDCPDLTNAQRQILNDWIAKVQNMPTPAVYTPPAYTFQETVRQGNDPEMIFVKGGTFKMTDKYIVTLDSYYIGKYEVTQKQWREIMDTNPSEFKNCDECPVENVSFEDIQAFLFKLNIKTGKKYYLPTEAQWEFAARGGNQSKGYIYAGISSTSLLYRYMNFCDKSCKYSWAYKEQNDGHINTAPVGQLLPNELDIFDMSGNVWEWCSDYWSDSYPKGSVTNPKGSTSESSHVLRGGSWYSFEFDCRISNRFKGTSSSHFNYIGFRVARHD
jgi:formylglycine-generating enzyme